MYTHFPPRVLTPFSCSLWFFAQSPPEKNGQNMFSTKHRQITKADNGLKIVDFRYQSVDRSWKRILHWCDEYVEIPESSEFLRVYVRKKEKRWPIPMYLAKVPMSKSGPTVYVGFQGLKLLNEYLAKGIGFYIAHDTNDIHEEFQRGSVKVESEIFFSYEKCKWAYTVYMLHEKKRMTQKTVHGFHTKNFAVETLRDEIVALKKLDVLPQWQNVAPAPEKL